MQPQLTPREIEILQAIADGRGTGSQIGQQLHISPHTVHAHLYRIFHKLAVHNRAAAIATAFRAGLLS